MHFFTSRDLKAAQMIVQRSLISKLMFYKLELRQNAAEAIKTFVYRKMKALLITVMYTDA